MSQRNWMKKLFEGKLKTWPADGGPVKSLWKKIPAMTSRATSLFESWRMALAAPEIESARKRCSSAENIEQLRLPHRRGRPVSNEIVRAAGKPLSSGHLNYRSLEMICIRRLGTWRSALSVANFVLFNRGRLGA